MGYHRDRCLHKVRYPRKGAAVDALSRRKVTAPDGMDGVQVYRCCFCAGWHLGHVPSLHTLEQVAAEIRGLC